MATKKQEQAKRFRTACQMGWRPDLPDQRDHMAAEAVHKVPQSVDLRTTGFLPAVYDQGQYGSCTGNAISAAMAFAIAKQGEKRIVPSRFFIYYGERVMEGDIQQDNGAQIRDGMKVVSNEGAPDELNWKYTTANFARKPTPKVYAEALKHRATSYARVTNRAENAALQVLASGFPIVFGFTVYESFEGADVVATGVVPMPGPSEKVIGGHACLIVGYDLASRRLIVRNSWGAGWGDKGYFTFPFAYAFDTNLSDDWWVLRADM